MFVQNIGQKFVAYQRKNIFNNGFIASKKGIDVYKDFVDSNTIAITSLKNGELFKRIVFKKTPTEKFDYTKGVMQPFVAKETININITNYSTNKKSEINLERNFVGKNLGSFRIPLTSEGNNYYFEPYSVVETYKTPAGNITKARVNIDSKAENGVSIINKQNCNYFEITYDGKNKYDLDDVITDIYLDGKLAESHSYLSDYISQ